MPQFCTQCSKENTDKARFCRCCGMPLVVILQQGSTLDRGRYEVQKSLKTGGMGAVYLLRDTRLDKECVLKEMIPPSQDSADLKEFKERFKNEALILSKLSHKNLPRVTDHFEEHNQCFLVMDYIEGDDLESLLSKNAPQGFAEKEVCSWALEILSVLEYLHSQKPLILYRDLKPSNIMVRRTDSALFLIDFGIAKTVQLTITHKTHWGTEGYAPIEQIQGEPETRSDLYALGATMHHLLTGKTPIPLKFSPIKSIRPDLSPDIGNVIDKALKLHAHDRYASAREMREALEGHMIIGPQGQLSAHMVLSVPKRQVGSNSSNVPLAIPSICINQQDGAEMVLIAAGDFLMGSPKSEGSDDEHPQHSIYLDAYYIYKYEVTNEQFAHFVRETGYNTGGDWKKYATAGRNKHPVVCVNWDDAMAYCQWAGGSLPTEAQWEKASRGTDGRLYPWGNLWNGQKCNWYKGPKIAVMANIYEKRGTTPVGSFSTDVSPYGIFDMAGNVWEWCSDKYNENYYKYSPSKNPISDSHSGFGQDYVVRSGSWLNDKAGLFRCANRRKLTLEHRCSRLGFRVCSSTVP